MGEEHDSDEAPDDVDQVIGSFLSEVSLWPVLVVVLGSSGAFGGALLVLVGIDHNPFAAVALVLLLGMTIDIAIRAVRHGLYRNLAKLVGLVWMSSFAMAGLAIWTGIAY